MTDYSLMTRRLAEVVAQAIARQKPGALRRELQAAAEDGDWHVERVEGDMFKVYVGMHEVAEVSVLSLQRPDDPSSN